jgi:hypothetical protein
MQHAHDMQKGSSDSPKRGHFASRGNMVLIGFLAIAGFYLVTEHTAHLFGALPYLLLLACPSCTFSCTEAMGGMDRRRARATTPR